MYGNALGRNVTLGAAVVLPATGGNRTMFIVAGVLFIAGLTTMIISRLAGSKS